MNKKYCLTTSAVALTLLMLASQACANTVVTTISQFQMGENDPGAVAGGFLTNGVGTINDFGTDMSVVNGGIAPVWSSDTPDPADLRFGASTLSVDYTTSFTNFTFGGAPRPEVDLIGMEVWVKSDDPALTSWITLNGANGSTNNGFGFYQSGGNYAVHLPGKVVVGSATATTEWTNLAVVWDTAAFGPGVAGKFYVNGIESATLSDAPFTADGVATIQAGANVATTGGGSRFLGNIDEFRMFTFDTGQFSPEDLNVIPDITDPLVLLASNKALLASIQASVVANPLAGSDPYVQLGISVADRFIQRVENGTPNGTPEADWTLLQLNEVAQVLSRTQQDLDIAILSGPKIVPLPTGGPVEVLNGLLWSETTTGSPGVKTPVIFSGYGSFQTVAQDIPVFQSLGATLVQQERGPSQLNSNGTITPYAAGIVDVLQTAETNNVKVDLLLSPHYFPQWAIDQAPDLVPIVGVPGFINYNIDHPKAREVIEDWLRAIVPLVKDSPALFSLNLANEPTYGNSGRDIYSAPRWVQYVQDLHGNIATLNQLYGTSYTSFSEVPVPDTQIPGPLNLKRAYYDWMRFNQKNLADWQGWMNGIVKDVAPDVPTTIKINPNIFRNRTYALLEGVDPELFADVTDIGGFDGGVFWPNASSPFDSWQVPQMMSELMYSFRGQPGYNSENHPIKDTLPAESIPPNVTYAALWQGFIHHVSASTTWVWEEPTDPFLEGSIYLRPADIDASGRAMLDAQRLSGELAAINSDKEKVAMLYSMPSLYWGRAGVDYGQLQQSIYTALNYLGVPITFISERQLATQFSDPNTDVEYIIVAESYLQDDTIAGLQAFVDGGGQIIKVGNDTLQWDEYSNLRTIPGGLSAAPEVSLTTDVQALMTSLDPLLSSLDLANLYDAGTQNIAFGVEYRMVPFENGFLVPMINFLDNTQLVNLDLANWEGDVFDLLSGELIDLDAITLISLQPRLLQLSVIPGDFDNNGVVDGVDLAQWEGDFGINGDSDADGDGDSDGADLLSWQRNFNSSVANPASTAVPEPTSLVLMICAFVALVGRRARNAPRFSWKVEKVIV